MQTCGGCSVQQVTQVAQILMNPVTWLLVATAITTVLTKKSGGKK
jgi:hypothetical protein